MSKDDRSRAWTGVFYPESAPEDWEDIVIGWHIPCIVSPLHDPKENKEGCKAETEGKPHYHINFLFSSNKSHEQVMNFMIQLGSKRCEKINDVRSMMRYLIHADDPDKQQFLVEQLQPFGGIKYVDYFIYDANSIEMCSRLEDIIRKYRIDNLVVLLDYLDTLEDYDLLNYVRHHNAYYVTKLLDANYQYKVRGLSKIKIED